MYFRRGNVQMALDGEAAVDLELACVGDEAG